MKWLVVSLLVVGCTKHNPAVCCENDVECARVGFDQQSTCSDGTVCVANTCNTTGCDGDEDCRDSNLPHCVSGTCSAGCDGNEDCTDADFPLCISGVCSVDCIARGGRIVFQTNRADNDDLFVMFADGFGAVPVISTSSNERSPRWSPDGTKLAFLSDDDADFDVYVTGATNTDPKNVSNNIAADNHIEWSPDGARLAFDSMTSPSSARTVAGDATEPHDLVGASSVANTAPSWRANSTELAFRSGSEIWKSHFDGTGSTALPPAPSSAGLTSSATWSPDGQRLAWFDQASFGANANRVVVADENGGAAKVGILGPSIGGDIATDLTWAPDGTKLALAYGTPGSTDIWVINVDGTGLTQLTTASGDDSHPRWSPDGLSIVFESGRDGNREIYVMKADGSEQTNLTSHPSNDGAPDWSSCPAP